MADSVTCRICNDTYGGFATLPQDFGGWYAQVCNVCGPIGYSHEAWDDFDVIIGRDSDRMRRAALAHLLSNADREGEQKFYFLNREQLSAGRETLSLPTPSVQRLNFIRMIGDHVLKEGQPFRQSPDTVARVGAFSNEAFQALHGQLQHDKGLIRVSDNERRFDEIRGKELWFSSFDLTLDGWDLYEAEKRGQEAGHYGFVALQFGQPILDSFLNAIGPGILKETGYELKDVREFSRAGIIDNIMRDQIRNAAFVVADLTHGNKGAYWEAGYAEGLGKPVIYICERAAFNAADTRPHFDTNHCTTIMWETGQEAIFIQDMAATIRRSLGMTSPRPAST